VRGYDLAALIFVREDSGPLTGLVRQLETHLEKVATRRPGEDNPGVFIIFCNDDPNLKTRLQEIVARERLTQVVLCTCESAGPKRYVIAAEADVTAVVYGEYRKVRTNIVLRKGELDTRKAGEIAARVIEVLPL
jgi:hypothetical protein